MKQTFVPLAEKIAAYQELEKRQKSRRALFLALLVSLAIAAAFALRFVAINKASPTLNVPSVASPQEKTVPVEEEPKPVAPPKVAEAFDRKVLKLQVLNGSGVPGAAAKASGLLQGLDYSDITTGDAATAGYYTVLNLGVRAGEAKLTEFVKADLGKIYPGVKIDSLDDLPANGEFDVSLIVGKF